MKRIFLFLLCLLLAVESILSLTACNSETDTKQADTIDLSYPVSDDIPAVANSDSAYLLDPSFTVTIENFSDCIRDYFAAPSVLRYTFDVPQYEELLIKHEKAAEFADPFDNLSLTPISSEQYYENSRMFNIRTSDNSAEEDLMCYFSNAIGFLHLYEQEGITYISFKRACDIVHGLYFSVEGEELLPALDQIRIALRDYAHEWPSDDSGNW